MIKNLEMLDLYTDYLICSTSYTTATGLSRVTNGAVSHDKVTRFLSSEYFTSSDLWQYAKPYVRTFETEEGNIIIDDSIEEKPYTDENDIIAWHWDHKENRSIKGINFLTALYEAGGQVAPIGCTLVEKTTMVIDKKTGKEKRKSLISKNEHYRNMLKQAVLNDVKFKCVLSDTWFSSVENMNYIKNELKKEFIMPLKENRKVYLSEDDKKSNKFVRIDKVEPGENTLVWLKDVEFPLRFVRQIFKDGDKSTGILNLVSSDIKLSNEQIVATYKKRWEVETYHKSLKHNVSLAKSPTKTKMTQTNHFFASVCAFIKLQRLSIIKQTNHFALKEKIYTRALMTAMDELERLKPIGFDSIRNYSLRPA